MLKIYVCEDNLPEQKQIVNIIRKTICIEEYDMAFALATNNPHKLLSALRQNPSSAIYFLDVRLNSDMNGIELAAEIRRFDPRGFIIFITAHEDACYLTFQYKVEAMDYIAKNDFRNLGISIADCLKKANELYTSLANTTHRLFRFKVGSQLITVPMDEVLYFEASSAAHRIIAHTKNGMTEFYGSIRDLTKQADDRFLLSHRGCLVNTEYISFIDSAVSEIHLRNGAICPVSARQLKYFKAKLV